VSNSILNPQAERTVSWYIHGRTPSVF